MLWANIVGLLLIGLIIWWFWLYNGEAKPRQAVDTVTITLVDGVYQPARIEVPANTPLQLRFLRKDPSPCAGVVIFDQLELSEELPLDQPLDITLQPLAPGRYTFACQMRMYRGELIVEA